jgi:predicted AAA+ superfamily ATPase
MIVTDTYRAREIASRVFAALRALPVVVITGLRQAGKTTFVREDPALRGRRYLTLDDFATLEAARSDPGALLEGEEPVTIDEVQRCPELLLAVKRAVDRRREPGRFVLTGSANLALLQGVGDSLAGRAIYLSLHPFTRRERLGELGARPFVLEVLERGEIPERATKGTVTEGEVLDGGMPAVVLKKTTDRALWFLGYEQTYLERDVRSLAQVADLVSFRRLLRLAALRGGQLLNLAELARDSKLTVPTVTRYLGLLEASFVVARLSPYLRSRATRLIKSSKLFIADSGLACHLTDVGDLGPTSDEPLRGALLETFVQQNLAGILSTCESRSEFAFWSVQGRHEVDFVVASGRRSIAIEVKAGERFGGRDLAGLRSFLDKTPGAVAGLLAYNGAEIAPLGDRLHAVPLGILLS